MGAAGCAAAGFNGDGRIDIACVGMATANLKWYGNVSPQRTPGRGRLQAAQLRARERERERAAHALLALDRHVAVHVPGDVARDRETETDTFAHLLQ